MMESPPLLSIHRLSRTFKQRQGIWGGQSVTHAVRDVTLDVECGRTLGIVGESGCGKSTLGRICVGLLPPSGGDVFFEGSPIYGANTHGEYKAPGHTLAGKLHMVFQDPYSSLNPRMRIGASVAEPLLCAKPDIAQKAMGGKSIKERVAEMLAQVGMDPDAARRYPHEFSGGQRQRVAIARALITRPSFIVCDEPTSSLDASVQSQVLNLLLDMQQELGLAYMFISHDLAVVRHMSDRVAVMYRGLIVEEGDAEEILSAPRHPYTRLLLASVPGESPQTDGKEKDAASPPQHSALSGPESDTSCPFAPRCPEVMAICRKTLPELSGRAGGQVRCFLYGGAE